MNNVESVEQVRAVLQQFQDGYTARDQANLPAVMDLFVPDEELEVIGTGAMQEAKDEWCIGRAAAENLVRQDWEGWGDLRLDVAGARIFANGDTAWLATHATVTITLEAEELYQDYLDSLKQQLSQEIFDPKQKLLDIAYGITHTASEVNRGEEYVWPLRFTAVLVRRQGRWLFHQMQFSFPTTRFPDERL